MTPEVDRTSDTERSVTVSHCECGLRWSGGNSKYCPAGHPYRFVDETYVPASQLEGAVSALESAYDAMVHRPVDSELFRAAIRDVAAALGRDEDYDDPPAGGQ